MKALLVADPLSGRAFAPAEKRVLTALRANFSSVDLILPPSMASARQVMARAGEDYEALVVAGGDGSFNLAVNAVMGNQRQPILGYLNFGTLGDVGRNFGISANLSTALAVLKAQRIRSIDVGELRNQEESQYFVYCAAFGAYSAISYRTSAAQKKIWRRWAYYAQALGEAFRPQRYPYHYVSRTLVEQGSAPFLMVLNGTHMAGFPVNKKGRLDDGLAEVYLTRPSLFNGLLHYLPWLRKPQDQAATCTFSGLPKEPWCLDGEEGPRGDATFVLHPQALRVFANGPVHS